MTGNHGQRYQEAGKVLTSLAQEGTTVLLDDFGKGAVRDPVEGRVVTGNRQGGLGFRFVSESGGTRELFKRDYVDFTVQTYRGMPILEMDSSKRRDKRSGLRAQSYQL